MNKTFYMVWNKDRAVPTVKHATYQLAAAEAQRLATLNPGREFVVLRAEGSFSVSPPPPPPVVFTKYYP